jgi:N-acyl-D-amino-acid deacylase
MRSLATAILTLAVAACAAARPSTSASAQGFVITNVRILDGSGTSARPGAVRVLGERIVAVGEVRPSSGDSVIDGRGLTLAPAFIDTHSHADRALARGSDALGALSQGIATVVVGQDGGSRYPLASFFETLERAHPPLNVASYVGHGTIRDRAMGEDYKRRATAAEIEQMRVLLAEEMRAGALGLSTGLEYDPGIYSSTDEVIALAKEAAAAGGRYISHVRSEDRAFWQAIDEVVRIGREAKLPVQVSHIKLAMKSLWGDADSLIAVLDRARAEGVDITADLYPYPYWQSGLTVLFPERNFDDLEASRFALEQVAPPDGITLTRYEPNPAYAMHTIAEIARMRGEEPPTTLLALIRESIAAERAGRPAGETIIATSMDERDIGALIAWPHANICTDGELDGKHPRGFGSFPRVLGRYVRERGVTSLPDAVRKMTSLAADHVGLRDRGRLVPGAYADLVLFDPATVMDRATPADPHAISVGIERVWVNGALAYASGAVTGARAGRVLRR